VQPPDSGGSVSIKEWLPVFSRGVDEDEGREYLGIKKK
jgi:hypothetical protein